MLRKACILLEWVVVLGLAFILMRAVFRPDAVPDHDPAVWRAWNHFTVLSYAGVRRMSDETYPSTERLEEQLIALRDAGYHTITPADALGFLQGRTPLPDKALLLLFEGGRKDCFIRATPALQHTGFLATLCIPTSVTAAWDSFHVNRRDMKRIAQMPQWSLGSMGHEAVRDIPTDDAGTPGHFLSHRKWSEGQPEAEQAFRARLTQDYFESKRILDLSGDDTITYVYPYADAGIGGHAAPLAPEINRAALSATYELAFVRSDDPINSYGIDPLYLNRLRVPGGWSGKQLVAELEHRTPRAVAVRHLRDAHAWDLVGKAELDATGLHLATNSEAWLTGVTHWTDQELTASLDTGTGEVAMYFRYTSPQAFVQIRLERGLLRIGERVDHRFQTLVSQKVPAGSPTGQVMRVRLKGERVWVWLDQTLVAGPIPLGGTPHSGRVGLRCLRDDVVVTRFDAQSVPTVLALADRYGDIPPDQRDGILAVLRPWPPSPAPAGGETEDAWRREALDAAADGIELIPVFSPTNGNAGIIAEQFQQTMRDPVMRSLVSRVAVRDPAGRLATKLGQLGFPVIQILSADAVRPKRELGESPRPDELWLIEGSAEQIRSTLHEWIQRCAPTRVSVEAQGPEGLPDGVRAAVRYPRTTPKDP